ncbi:MAG: hypothetical protein HOP28_12340 [Gemmatimonadales bacterium]|nr:hypothetical protein [Gemmatimonadales bacterium]
MTSKAGRRGRGGKKPRNPSRGISFEPEDFEVLDLALNQDRELRLCAGAVKAARAADVRYPIRSARVLARLLPKRSVVVEGHHLRPGAIVRYLPEQYFPIRSEAELVSRCYVALVRCRGEMTWAAQAPPDPQAALAEFARTTRPRRRG